MNINNINKNKKNNFYLFKNKIYIFDIINYSLININKKY